MLSSLKSGNFCRFYIIWAPFFTKIRLPDPWYGMNILWIPSTSIYQHRYVPPQLFLTFFVKDFWVNTAKLPENFDFWASGAKIWFFGRQTAKNYFFHKKNLNCFLDLKWHPKKGEQAVFEDRSICSPHTSPTPTCSSPIMVEITEPQLLRWLN